MIPPHVWRKLKKRWLLFIIFAVVCLYIFQNVLWQTQVADREGGRGLGVVRADQRKDFNNVQGDRRFENKENIAKQIALPSGVDKNSNSMLGVDARLRAKYGSARIVLQPDKHGPGFSECPTWFHNSFEENLAVIANYSIGDAKPYLEKLGAYQKEPNTTVDFPVFVTAANSGFFDVTQALLKSVHEIIMPKYKDMKLIYYDLGLQDAEVTKLKKYCKCEVRKFPFEDFPGHVRQLKTYAWKPIIIMKLLMEFGFVWWMDSSVRWTTDKLEESLTYCKANSILFFTYDKVFSVAQHTDTQTMKYFGEDPCKFRHFGETEATFGAYHFDEVSQMLVRSWAACAFNENCIAPPGTASKLSCSIHRTEDGRCHRFDQAVLSLMLRRLYHEQNDYPQVPVPINLRVIERGQRINYFPND